MAFANPPISYVQQAVTGPSFATACFSEPSIRAPARRTTKEKGTPSATTATVQHDTTGASYMILWWINPGKWVDWHAGQWVVRLNVTSGSLSIGLTKIYFCHMRLVSGKWQSQSQLGSLTILTPGGDKMTDGAHSWTCPGIGGVASPVASTDQVMIAMIYAESPEFSDSFTFDHTLSIDSPFRGQRRLDVGSGAPNRKRNVSAIAC